MPWLAAAIGAAGSLIGGAMNNSAARHAATTANERNIYNYQHRYQWAMDDMQKAGLNPMLAATQGIGGSINGASALAGSYNLGEGATAGMSAGASAKQADTAARLADGTINKLESEISLNAASARNLAADAAGKEIANKLASDLYADNLALYRQNLANAAKQGILIDEQTKNAIYQRDVVMPSQANMMIAQGNAANSSAAYNGQLTLQSKEATERANSQNAMRSKYGFDTDSSMLGSVGGVTAKLFDKVKQFYLGR